MRRPATKQAAEREARRHICTDCGAKFTDARWETAQATDWGAPKDSHPRLCDGCKQRAAAVAASTFLASSSRQLAISSLASGALACNPLLTLGHGGALHKHAW